MEVNKIMNGDCIEEIKKLEENSVDAIVTDPPYFLINDSGSGFMGKEWESLNSNKFYNIVWKSKEFVRIVEELFMCLKVESNLEEEFIVQKNVHTNQKKMEELGLNVKFVEKENLSINLKLKADTNSVQGIVLTKQEVLGMSKGLLRSPMNVIENQKENVLFVIPYSLIKSQTKSIVQENALKNLINKECEGKITQVTLMEEVRIKGVIEGMIGKKLEKNVTEGTNGNVNVVEKSVEKKKYKHIILNHTEMEEIMKWITSLLFVSNAIPKLKENLPLFLMQTFQNNWATECLRVLKPGGFLLSFGGTRTYHRLVCGIEDAGFEIRDTIMWLYGSGFPKSLNIGKQIDKINGKTTEEFISLGKYLREKRGDIPQNQISKFFPSKTGGLTGCVSNWELGMNVPTKEQWIILKRELKLDDKFDYLVDRIEAEREKIGERKSNAQDQHKWLGEKYKGHKVGIVDITLPNLPEAKQWEGWGTALKPACEPIVVARKPLSEKNVALNVLKWGTGGINIDECRIELNGEKQPTGSAKRVYAKNQYTEEKVYGDNKETPVQGRFPANIILDEEAGKSFPDDENEYLDDASTQQTLSGDTMISKNKSASRFFYCAKASKSERNLGCEELKEVKNMLGDKWSDIDRRDGKKPVFRKNTHPTVKPIKLMEYLIKLVTKEGAIVLDPFLGSGTTAIACAKLNRKFIGIEKEEEYIRIAEARLKPFLEQEVLTTWK